jgi:hypothetical protein
MASNVLVRSIAAPALRVSIAACTVAVLAGSTLAMAEPVAEKPDLQVGDVWVFRQSGTKMGKAVEGQLAMSP